MARRAVFTTWYSTPTIRQLQQGSPNKAVSLYQAITQYKAVKIALHGRGNCTHDLDTNKAASHHKAVILLWHTSDLLGGPYIML